MKLHRFIGNFSLINGNIRVTDLEVVNQMRNVLRLRAGDELILVAEGEGEARGRIVRYDDTYAEIETIERIAITPEALRNVTLYCAILKRENFEFVVQKATEAGVTRIVPVLTAHTVKLNLNETRLAKIAKEAAEQSGRITIPNIAPMRSFDDALAEVREHAGATILFDGSGAPFSIAQVMNNTSMSIFIGPEGGWSDEELQHAKEASATIMSLGTLTLRAETAAIISTYLLCQLKQE